jgi:integrase
MTVRIVKRRGERRLVLDIVYTKPDGSQGRFRRDAEVQMLAAARAEERRRLALLVSTGSPTGVGEPPKGERPPAPKTLPPLTEVAAEYLRIFAPTRLKPSTIHGYKRLLEGFLLPRIGRLRLDQVDAKVVRELDAECVKRGAKPETRRKVHIVLRSILRRFAVEAGYLETAPSMPAMPKAGAKIANTLTDADVSRILAVAPASHRLAFLLAAHAGLRAGEIRGLKWRDVDLAAGQLVVRESVCRGHTASPKSGHERIVPLTPQLRAALASARTRDRDALVARTEQGTPWREWGLRQAFARSRERAGVEPFRLHDLRHYFVTALFRRGVAAPTVQALAGHAHLTTTQRYAHVARVDLRAAIERLAGEGVVTAW